MLTQTSTTLLNSLLEQPGDQAAWRTVCDRYGAAVFRFARRRGLSEADADDVLSETLAALFEAYRAGRYDRERGRFRTWVFGIAMNKVHDARRRLGRSLALPEGAGRAVPADSITDAAADASDRDFDADVERTLAWQCLEAVRARVAPLTYQAFDLYAVKGRSPEDVARILGVEVGAVYVAKSRVLAAARREYEKLRAADQEV